MSSLDTKLEFVSEIPFDSVLKRMTVSFREKDRADSARLLILCKGATESVLSCCIDYVDNDGINQPLTPGITRYLNPSYL